MKRCRFYILLWAQAAIFGQTPPNTQAIAPASMSFYSYSPVAPAVAPPGSQFLITFPGQASGSQITRPGCTNYSQLKYAHYTYDGTWHGPVTGPVYGYFANFYASANPINNTSGLSGNMAFAGSIASNNDTINQVFIQSYYWSADACYEYGPEVGFYRLLQTPGNAAEESTVYFYYSMHANCYGDSTAGTCRDKVTGASLQPTTISKALTVPATNSQGGKNWIYSAYLTSPTNFRVTITDPYNGNNAVTPANYAVDPNGFFGPTAAAMYNPGLTGYLTITQQRNSSLGGITDSMPNPLKMTIIGLSQLLYLSTVTPPPVFSQTKTYSRAFGNCADGNKTIVTAGVSSSAATPVIRSYPSCTVTVYVPGTTTPATIYSDPTGTSKANPFTADTSGRWFFYANNGSYDIRLSGGGIPTPFTLGDVPLFTTGAYFPHAVLAYAQSGAAGIVGAYNPAGTFYSWFTTGVTTSNMLWTLPTADSAGCLSSNGSFVLSFVPCGTSGGGGGTGTPTPPGGNNQTIQFNNGGVFGGDGNLLWDKLTQVMSVSGVAGTPAIRANGGYILANGGLVSNVGSWQGINSDKDGALLRAYHVAPTSTVVGTGKGGYINFAPLGYANSPVPLDGLASFGLHTGLLWVGGINPLPADTTYSLNTNLYVNASAGFATANGIYNSVQAPNGGMAARSFTASGYVQVGSSNGPPTATTNDAIHAGALYFDTAAGTFQGYTGAGWVPLSGGGTGGGGGTTPPGGVSTSVQFNSGGSFSGDTFFFYSSASRLLTVSALNANSAGIAVVNGYMTADNGYLSGACIRYNCFQAASSVTGSLVGGMAARSFTATQYIQAGNNPGPPNTSLSDTFHAGAMFWDTTGAGGMKVYDGSAWVALGGSGTATAGGPVTSVQFNSGGALGGDASFFWDTGAKLLTIVTAADVNPGLAVGPGYMQADGGYISGSCNRYNCFQAVNSLNQLQGGMYAKSFTALNYIQAGNYAGALASGPTMTTADAAHAGAMSWSTTGACMAVYNGTAWVCIGGGGGSGTPGGANTNIQFNNSGAFGGSANLTWNNSLAQLVITGIGGSTDTQNSGANYVNSLAGGVTNKTIWAVAKDANGFGLFRLSDGTGTGGFDGNGAWVYATASNGFVYAQAFKAGTSATTGITFTNNNSSFQVDAAGNMSATGVVALTGGSSGFNVTANNAANTVQTTGGMNTGAGGSGAGGYSVNGTVVIDSTGTFIGKVSTSDLAVTGKLLNSIRVNGGVNASDDGTAVGGYYVHGTQVINSSGMWIGGAVQSTGLISGTSLSISGTALFSGATSSTTGFTGNGGSSVFEILSNTALDSIRTVGGVNVSSGGDGNAGYFVHGSKVINASGGFVGSTVQATGLISGPSLSITDTGSTAIFAGPVIAQSSMNVTGNTSMIGTLALTGTGLNGYITQYRGIPTVGYGVAPMYYNYSVTGNTASTGVAQVVINGAAPVGGWYRASVTMTCHNTGGTPNGVATLFFGTVDGLYAAYPGVNLNCNAGPYVNSGVLTIYTDGTTSAGCNGMCWNVSASSFSNATYQLGVFVERLR